MIPAFGSMRAVTRALQLRDGSLARSFEDFRKG
jgi:hypothetical protein